MVRNAPSQTDEYAQGLADSMVPMKKYQIVRLTARVGIATINLKAYTQSVAPDATILSKESSNGEKNSKCDKHTRSVGISVVVEFINTRRGVVVIGHFLSSLRCRTVFVLKVFSGHRDHVIVLFPESESCPLSRLQHAANGIGGISMTSRIASNAEQRSSILVVQPTYFRGLLTSSL